MLFSYLTGIQKLLLLVELTIKDPPLFSMSKQVSTQKIKNTEKQLVILVISKVQTLCGLSSTEYRQNGNPSEAINEVTVSEFNIMQRCTFTFHKVTRLSIFIFSSDPIFFCAIAKKHIY